MYLSYAMHCLHAVDRWHIDVHQYHIGLQLFYIRLHCFCIENAGNEFHIMLVVQQRFDALPQGLVIVV